MLSTFIVNKVDDHCVAAVETTKLEKMDSVFGDIITFRQVFEQSSREKTCKERVEELRKRLKDHLQRTNVKSIKQPFKMFISEYSAKMC